jgi:predicted exporter
MKFSIKNRRFAGIFWVCLIILLSGFSFMKIRNGFSIETNILKMLPFDNDNRILNEASDRFSEKLSRNVLFIVSHKDRDTALSAAAVLKQDLSANDLFQVPNQTDWFDFYFKYRFSTIPSSMESVLNENEDFESFRSYFYKNLLSPMSNIYGEMLNKDPLMLFPKFVGSLAPQQNKNDYENGNIIIEDTESTIVLISAFLKKNGFERDIQTAFNRFIEYQKNKMSTVTSAQLDYTGVVTYANRYEERAKFETGYIGILSFCLVFLLILIAYRSVKCLLWGWVPIISALLCGLAGSVLVFDRIHLISITMGTCLIGISIDYSFHYLSEYAFCKGKWDSSVGLKHILPGISLSFLTTTIGYAIFFFIPFTGLRQIAVFTITGLTGAYLTVVILFPLIFRKKDNSGGSYKYFKPIILVYFRVLDRSAFRYTALTLLLLIIITGLPKLTFRDDMSIFEMKTEDLDKTVNSIQKLTGTEYEREFLLITGESQEKLLQNIENITGKLDQLQKNNEISGYLALTKFVPSIRTQKARSEMLVKKLQTEETRIAALFLETGFKPEVLQNLISDVKENQNRFITIDEWLNSPVSIEHEKLWIGKIKDQYFSAVLLNGIKNMKALEKITIDKNTHLINNHSRISQLIKDLRESLIILIPAIYSIFLLILIIRYGFKKSLSVFIPSVMTLFLTVSILSLFSIEINIMHILAMILVLALGIDYSVFLAESIENPSVTCISIVLASATTIFSFGMLALSMIPALKSIGLTVIIGISITMLLSPIAADRKRIVGYSNEL